MEITVRIDNGDARVFVRQIFANHTGAIEEGNYIFALPSHATISDFATWDGPMRLPAVILERKRAEEIYNQLKQQSIDPGLLQMGERGAGRGQAHFGLQRAHRSDSGLRNEAAGDRISRVDPGRESEVVFRDSAAARMPIRRRPRAICASISNCTPRTRFATFRRRRRRSRCNSTRTRRTWCRATSKDENVNLGEDFVATYDLDPAASDTLQLLTYRNPVSGQPSPTETAPVRSTNEPGFFEAEALLGFRQLHRSHRDRQRPSGAPKTVIVLFDTSLSMQWEKLERSYQALETLLHTLRPERSLRPRAVQHRNAGCARQLRRMPATFNTPSMSSAPAVCAAAPICNAPCRPDCSRPAAPGATNTYLVILSDGGATRGPIQNGKLAAWYASAWKQLPDTQRPRTYILAVGDDANLPLFRMLARQDGLLEHVLSTEPMEFKLNSFLSKIGRSPVGQLESSDRTRSAGRHGLSAAGRNVFGIARFMGGPLPEAAGERQFHRPRCARWRCRSR